MECEGLHLGDMCSLCKVADIHPSRELELAWDSVFRTNFQGLLGASLLDQAELS